MSTIAPIAERREEKVEFKRILMATDFSDASQRALAYALRIARRYRAEISVLHAIPSEPREAVPMDPLPRELDRHRLEAEQAMGRLVQEVHLEGSRYHTLVQQGSVWKVFSSVSQREDIDLLVLGTRGRGGLKKLALGSVAEELLRLASCPVLTVGPNAVPITSEVADFKSILFATDFGSAAAKAFPYALFLAEDCRAKLILLHMVPPMSVVDIGPSAFGLGAYAAENLTEWQARMRKESSSKLMELIPSNAKLVVPPEYVVETNFLPDGILDTAATYQAELIVMGANRARSARLVAHIPWAVTHDVLCEARCPVLTVRD